MAVEKTMDDFLAYLATFVPEYPMKKGYVARLLLEGAAKGIPNVQRKITAFVQPLVHDKFIWDYSLEAHLRQFNKVLKKLLPVLTLKWSMLLELCNEILPINFKELLTDDSLQFPQQPSLPQSTPPWPSVSAEPGSDHFNGRSSQSSIQHPSPSLPQSILCQPSILTASTLSDRYILTEPTASTLSDRYILTEPTASTLSDRSSLKRLRNGCEQCAQTQQTFKKIHARLRKKLVEQRRKHNLELTRGSSISEAKWTIQRRDSSIRLWKAKYMDLFEVANRVGELRSELNISQQSNKDMHEKLQESQATVDRLQKQFVEASLLLQNVAEENDLLVLKNENLKQDVANLKKLCDRQEQFSL